MHPLKLNRDSVIAIRDELKLPLFSLIKFMKNKNWDFEISLPNGNGRGSVYFEPSNSNWNGRHTLASKCSYGYSFSARDDINYVAQRAAELCLQLKEVFTTLIPTNPNIHGDITPCTMINKAPYDQISFDDFVKKHEDKDLIVYSSAPWQRDFDAIYFTYYIHTVTILKDEYPTFLSELEYAQKVTSGTYAVGQPL